MRKMRLSDAGHVADLIRHLGRLTYADNKATTLTAAQWTALSYFGRANNRSRTSTAFADYHATTAGCASQIVKSLVAKGLLVRHRSGDDGRSARFDLTEKGRVLSDNDPFDRLIRSLAARSKNQLRDLMSVLSGVLAEVSEDRRRKTPRSCATCVCLKESLDPGRTERALFCTRSRLRLSEAELGQLCMCRPH